MALFNLIIVSFVARLLLEDFEWSATGERNEELAWTFGFESSV